MPLDGGGMLPLFNELPRVMILGNSYTRSCINPVLGGPARRHETVKAGARLTHDPLRYRAIPLTVFRRRKCP